MDSIRFEKAQNVKAAGGNPYAAMFPRTHRLAQARDAQDGTHVAIAGRVVLWRDMGKMTFATLQDESGRLQIALRENEMAEGRYTLALELVDLGDFIGVEGERFATKTGEPTILVRDWTMLTKALRQPPEKWHGLADQETAWRQRYLDLMSNRDTLERFKLRSRFLKLLREFYWSHDFTEVETPVLVNAASGALAKPFVTHHEAYDMDVFLRIAPETFLKECLIGGFDRVFEVARCFRNEGLDPSHLQDFTMVEHYAAYWDYTHNMKFTEDLFSKVLQELLGTLKINIPDREGKILEVDFTPPWPRISILESIKGSCGIDIEVINSKSALIEAIKKNSIQLDVAIEDLGYGSLVDQLYKKVARPKIVSPTFLIEHPIELSPLARRNDSNPRLTDRFQLVVGGWEIVNAYSELVDPVDQAKRFDEQSRAAAGGDNEAHRKDDEFVKALEYGCPPASGWGMGIDRFVALITQQPNIRDTVLFPLMKPLKKESAIHTKSALKKAKINDEAPQTLGVPDERTKRFVAVLNKKGEKGRLMNALGHMTAGLSELAGHADDLCFLTYEDKDGNPHPNISHFPFIVLQADNGNQIRQVRQKALEKGIPFTDFTTTMTIGTSQEQQDATKATPEAQLEYLGICLFGDTAMLKELTKKFSLFT